MITNLLSVTIPTGIPDNWTWDHMLTAITAFLSVGPVKWAMIYLLGLFLAFKFLRMFLTLVGHLHDGVGAKTEGLSKTAGTMGMGGGRVSSRNTWGSDDDDD